MTIRCTKACLHNQTPIRTGSISCREAISLAVQTPMSEQGDLGTACGPEDCKALSHIQLQ